MAIAQLVIGGAEVREKDDVELGDTEPLREVTFPDELAAVLLGITSEELDPALAEALLAVNGAEEDPVIEDDPVIEEEPAIEEEPEAEDEDPPDEALAIFEVLFPDPNPPGTRGQAVGIGSWKPVIQPI